MNKTKTLNFLKIIARIGYFITAFLILIAILNSFNSIEKKVDKNNNILIINTKRLNVLEVNDSINRSNTVKLIEIVKKNTDNIGIIEGTK